MMGSGTWLGQRLGKCCCWSTVVADVSLKYPVCPDVGTEAGGHSPVLLGALSAPVPLCCPRSWIKPSLDN